MDFVQQIAEKAAKMNIGFIAYALDDELMYAFENNEQLTPRGMIIKKQLQSSTTVR